VCGAVEVTDRDGLADHLSDNGRKGVARHGLARVTPKNRVPENRVPEFFHVVTVDGQLALYDEHLRYRDPVRWGLERQVLSYLPTSGKVRIEVPPVRSLADLPPAGKWAWIENPQDAFTMAEQISPGQTVEIVRTLQHNSRHGSRGAASRA
jgi:hypothetical protein